MLVATGVFEICPLDSWRRSSTVNRCDNCDVAQVGDDDLCGSSWGLRSNVFSDFSRGPWARLLSFLMRIVGSLSKQHSLGVVNRSVYGICVMEMPF
jgi:hypothetical protein